MFNYRIKELGLLERCHQITSREGRSDEILKKHTPETIEILKQTVPVTDAGKLEELSSKYDAVFINNASYKAALLSVGCAIDLVDAVIKGTVQNGMAIIRYLLDILDCQTPTVRKLCRLMGTEQPSLDKAVQV